MARTKPKSTLLVAGGAGGTTRVEDRRFDRAEWPISSVVPAERAEDWFRYVELECERCGWNSAGMSQLEPRENSGSLMLLERGVERISIVWDRVRDGALNVRARPAAGYDLAEAQDFFRRANDRSSSRATERRYWWGLLEYDGRAWRGDLWLEDDLCLGPPSKQYEVASYGPRALIVAGMVDSISQAHSAHVFGRLLDELSAFLSVVTGIRFHRPQQRQVWTWRLVDGQTECSVGQLGYVETQNQPAMPVRGARPTVPFGADPFNDHEQPVPAEIVDLWTRYRALSSDRRRQFLAAAFKFQEALSHWGERDTVSFVSMVIACEALKGADPIYREHNIYNVVEALLDKATAERLRTQLFDRKVHPNIHPQGIRNAHLHAGELRGLELSRGSAMSDFRDPTFDTASRELFTVTKSAIIEWLKRGGGFPMSPLRRKITWRRWVRERALVILPIGMVVGLLLGWLLRALWLG